MLNLKKLLTKILEKLNTTGAIYSASWTASSSSASGTALTGYVTLPIGTYVMVLITPTASANFVLGLSGNYKQVSQNGDCFVIVANVTTDSTQIGATSAQTASVTFTNTSRGSLKAIKVG